MARRRRTGAAEDIIDLTALLPWWASVALALVLYVVLHRLSAPVPTAGVQPGQIGGFIGIHHGKHTCQHPPPAWPHGFLKSTGT